MPYNESIPSKCCSVVEKMNEVAMWLHQHYNGDADLEENFEQIAKDLLQ